MSRLSDENHARKLIGLPTYHSTYHANKFKHRPPESKVTYTQARGRAAPKCLHRESELALHDLVHAMTEATGMQYSVDHIVPLRGNNVCGLHTPDNWEIMPERQNRKKGNKF